MVSHREWERIQKRESVFSLEKESLSYIRRMGGGYEHDGTAGVSPACMPPFSAE